MLKSLIMINVVISCLTLAGCVEVNNSNETSDQKVSVEDELAADLVEGAYAYVTYDVSGMGTTEENLHNFVRNSGSSENVERMVFEGKLLPVEKGTSVQILDTHFTWIKVEILSGPYSGTVAYALREHIGSKPKEVTNSLSTTSEVPEEISNQENNFENEANIPVENNSGSNSNVEPVSESTEKLYRVRAGVFSIEENALALEKDIKEHGIETGIVEKDGFYVLYVGAFRVRKNADNRLAELQSFGLDGLIKFE
ncbi:SPOR domain-containing protein [Actinomycetes bacterium NPDC127524]